MAVMAVDAGAPVAVKERLEAFAGEVLAAAMNRPVQLVNGGLYLRGLLEQGARKSLEPMVARLGGDADYQSMQQFWPIARGIRRWSSRRWLSGSRRRSTSRRGCSMTRGFRRTARTRRVSSASTRGRWARPVTVRSACRCTRSARGGRCRWDGRCICRRTGARISSGGARRRSPRRSLSRPSRSSGSSWSSAPPAGMSRRRRCSAITPTARTPGCAIASIRPGCEYVLSVGPKTKVFAHGTLFAVPAKKHEAHRAAYPAAPGPRGRADRRADRTAAKRRRADRHLPRRPRRRAGHLAVHLRAGARRARLAQDQRKGGARAARSPRARNG